MQFYKAYPQALNPSGVKLSAVLLEDLTTLL